MKKLMISLAAVAVMYFVNACDDGKEEVKVPKIPKVEDASAKYVGSGPQFQLVVEAGISDDEGLKSVQITHRGWNIDESLSVSGKEYALNKTFTAPKAEYPSRWKVVLVVENSLGEKATVEIAVADESTEPGVPSAKDASAIYFREGRDFKLTVKALISDEEKELETVQIRHQGWQIDALANDVSGKAYALDITFPVSKVDEPTVNKVELILKNNAGGTKTIEIEVTDESTVPTDPKVENATAEYMNDGDNYTLTVTADLSDDEGLESVQIVHDGWQIDALAEDVSGKAYALDITFPISKAADPTTHKVKLIVTNIAGVVFTEEIDVTDLSDKDEIAPVVELIKPTVTNFYVIDPTHITWEIEARVTDNQELSKIYLKVWNATFEFEDTWTRVSDNDKQSYTYSKQVTLPSIAEYQYLIRATDESENESEETKGSFTMGIMDRLYLSDAKNEFEVTNQGFDIYGNISGVPAWGLGTLVPMRKEGTNKFVLDAYYYRNDADENIRFITFAGDDKPFGGTYINTGAGREIYYTLNGDNVFGMSQSVSGKLTHTFSESNFKLPVAQKGYYKITVDMTERTVEAIPVTPDNPDFAVPVKFPGYPAANPYEYLAVSTGATVISGSNWIEPEANENFPKIFKEADHDFLYSGIIETLVTGNGANINFKAPRTVLTPATEGSSSGSEGWFRLETATRADMVDTYGDPISRITAVGEANFMSGAYGFSLIPGKKWHLTYDLMTYRLRIVEVQE